MSEAAKVACLQEKIEEERGKERSGSISFSMGVAPLIISVIRSSLITNPSLGWFIVGMGVLAGVVGAVQSIRTRLRLLKVSKCPKCGKPITQRTPYCPFCGNQLGSS